MDKDWEIEEMIKQSNKIAQKVLNKNRTTSEKEKDSTTLKLRILSYNIQVNFKKDNKILEYTSAMKEYDIVLLQETGLQENENAISEKNNKKTKIPHHTTAILINKRIINKVYKTSIRQIHNSKNSNTSFRT